MHTEIYFKLHAKEGVWSMICYHKIICKGNTGDILVQIGIKVHGPGKIQDLLLETFLYVKKKKKVEQCCTPNK